MPYVWALASDADGLRTDNYFDVPAPGGIAVLRVPGLERHRQLQLRASDRVHPLTTDGGSALAEAIRTETVSYRPLVDAPGTYGSIRCHQIKRQPALPQPA